MGYHKIVKFTGYMVVPPGTDESEVVEAIEGSRGYCDGILKHLTTESRETDWEYCENDNHPLNRIDSPIEVCEKYFE